MFGVGMDSEIVPHYAGLRKNKFSMFLSSYFDDFTCIFAQRTKNKKFFVRAQACLVFCVFCLQFHENAIKLDEIYRIYLKLTRDILFQIW